MRRKNIGIQMIEAKIMRKVVLVLISLIVLTSCTVSKPTSETEKGFFFKWKHKKTDEK